MFKVRGYPSRVLAEQGRVTPSYASSTGCYQTALHVAQEIADFYGAAVLENSDTGNRTFFAPAA